MISVIIPLYNKEKIIERTLRSVLSQDYDDFEVVIVDDGSTDGSLVVVEREYPKIESELGVNVPVTIIKQENGGPSKARNTGVKNAEGDWIVFLDADDELLPSALLHFSNIQKEHTNICLFGCSYLVSNGKKELIPYRIKEGYYLDCYKVHALNMYNYRTGCTMVRKDIALKCPFNEKLWRYEDLECFFRMHKYGGFYIDPNIVLKQNVAFCEASVARKNIKEDYVGHLSLTGKSFWRKMSQYRLFIEERNHYLQQCMSLYKSFFRRRDLYFIYHLLKFLGMRKEGLHL